MKFFTAGEHQANVPLSLFAAQYSDFTYSGNQAFFSGGKECYKCSSLLLVNADKRDAKLEK